MAEETTIITKEDMPDTYPMLPLRDMVVFPQMVTPLFVGREKSICALNTFSIEGQELFVVAQKNTTMDDPAPEDLYPVGTIVKVLQLLHMQDGTVKLLIKGITRAQMTSVIQEDPCFRVTLKKLPETNDTKPEELIAITRSIFSQFEQYSHLGKHFMPDAVVGVKTSKTPEDLLNAMIMLLEVDLPVKQQLLEMDNIFKRLEKIYALFDKEIDVMRVEQKIRHRVKNQMDKTQREYYLNEQIKAIHKELGDGEEDGGDTRSLQNKIKQAKLPKEAHEKAITELRKLRMMGPMSAEASIVRSYLDWILALPWHRDSKTVDIDLDKAKQILDADHFGLEKVKERIVEFLAVQKKSHGQKAPILCLVGPPGVGKTSLGQSIAKATGRHFVRASLGGMRDEAEIRGHRRTYIGAMPGKIIQGMKKAKTLNSLFLLDEIDKMGTDWRGDPSSALLEVLDPEQNATFNDHYLELDYDLSPVMFVTTANTLNMSRPLLDRMEIIQLSGYTEDEKVQIALRHLLPKQMTEAALTPEEFSLSESAIRELIRRYTREAGVRSLEREIAKLARKVVKEIMIDKKDKVAIDDKNLATYAGVPRFSFGVAEQDDLIGVTTGLAWTEVGGEILSIEAVTMPGKGAIIQTGQLGDVMKESIEAARSYIRSRHTAFGIPTAVFEKSDIHVHVPEGATPKDGPSAGVAMCTSLVSALTGIPVRKDIAMTGEITLRGRVLPIGGLKEKLLAALRGGLKVVLIPEENQKDLADIPDNVKQGMHIIPVSHVEEVLHHALVRPLTPIKDEIAPLITVTQNTATMATNAPSTLPI